MKSLAWLAVLCVALAGNASGQASEPTVRIDTSRIDAARADATTIDALRELSDDGWRRTRLGWERRSTWQSVTSAAKPAPLDLRRVHPAIVAALVALVSVGALLLDENRRTSKAALAV